MKHKLRVLLKMFDIYFQNVGLDKGIKVIFNEQNVYLFLQHTNALTAIFLLLICIAQPIPHY